MRQRTATVSSILLLFTLTLGFIVSLSIIILPFPIANLEQTYIAVLRLDGILFGFAMAIFGFFFDKMKVTERDWSYIVLISIFFCLLLSIMAAFIGLLNAKLPSGFVIVSVSFALTAILEVIFLIQDIAFPHERQKKRED